jgi:hypothetical protein
VGSHLVGHPDERKGWSEEPSVGNSDNRKVLLFLTRHIVFLEYESNQGEHGGSRNWLRGEVGIYAHSDDLVAISLNTRGNNMTDDMEPVLQEPLKLVHGRAATAPYGRCTKS